MKITIGSIPEGMDWLSFIASMTSAAAWPIAVFAIIFIFRSKISSLLESIQSLSYGGATAAFSSKLDETEKKVDMELPHTSTNNTERDLTTFEKIVNISPESAIIQAWIEVERSIFEAAKDFDLATNRKPTLRDALSKLVDLGRIDLSTSYIIDELRILRNKAAHYSDRELTTTDAYRFRDMADRVLEALEKSPRRLDQ